MSDFLIVLAFAALPAAGTFAGGLAAEIFYVSDRVLSLALHLAAGIVLAVAVAVVGLELVPQALGGNPPWIPIAAFIAVGAVCIGLEHLIDAIKDRLATGEESTGPPAIFTGVPPRPLQRWHHDRHRQRDQLSTGAAPSRRASTKPTSRRLRGPL